MTCEHCKRKLILVDSTFRAEDWSSFCGIGDQRHEPSVARPGTDSDMANADWLGLLTQHDSFGGGRHTWGDLLADLFDIDANGDAQSLYLACTAMLGTLAGAEARAAAAESLVDAQRAQIVELQAQARVDESMRTTQRVAYTQDGQKVGR